MRAVVNKRAFEQHLLVAHLLGAVGIIHEVAHCDEGVTQSFCGCDPFVGVQTQHPLQEVDKLPSISFLSQHVGPFQMRRQIDLEKFKENMVKTINDNNKTQRILI